MLIVPPIGALAAVCDLISGRAGWDEIRLLLYWYYPIALGGVTFFLHRFLIHRSFKIRWPFRVIFMLLGMASLEGDPVLWAANHGRHHAESDTENDLHSPFFPKFNNVLTRIWNTFAQFCNSQFAWVFRGIQADPAVYAPHLFEDRVVMTMHGWYPVVGLLSVFLPFFIWGIEGFIWASLTRIFLVHHVTWFVNSLCHMIGSRDFETAGADRSRNIWWLFWIMCGENWHNFHHAFQDSARQVFEIANRWFKWFEGVLDPTWAFINIMEWAGVVYDVKVVSHERWERRKVRSLKLRDEGASI